MTINKFLFGCITLATCSLTSCNNYEEPMAAGADGAQEIGCVMPPRDPNEGLAPLLENYKGLWLYTGMIEENTGAVWMTVPSFKNNVVVQDGWATFRHETPEGITKTRAKAVARIRSAVVFENGSNNRYFLGSDVSDLVSLGYVKTVDCIPFEKGNLFLLREFAVGGEVMRKVSILRSPRISVVPRMENDFTGRFNGRDSIQLLDSFPYSIPNFDFGKYVKKIK